MKQHKEYYKVFTSKKYQMTKQGMMQFPSRQRSKIIPVTFNGKQYDNVHYSQINTKEKLAQFLHERRGSGTIVVNFYGKAKNKRYNPQFRCLKHRCKWYGHPKHPCHQYPRMKIGSSCIANRKYNPKVGIKRAEVVIREGDKGIAYEYTFDKMRYMPFWLG